MRTDKEIQVIISTLVEVSLTILPNFSSESCLKIFHENQDNITDLDFGEIKSYSKMLEDFKNIKERLVLELTTKLCRKESNIVFNQQIKN